MTLSEPPARGRSQLGTILRRTGRLPTPAGSGSRTSGLLTNRSPYAAFLCYHSIAPRGPRFLSLSAELFERQLAWLGRAGWRTGTSATLAGMLGQPRRHARTAFLTFDDGYLDNYTTALPLLRAYGASATVFVLPPALERGELDWPEIADERSRHPEVMRSMTWDMLDDLVEGEIEVGSHGLHHAHLDRLEEDALLDELLDSRRAIEHRFGSCRALAYPFGHWSPAVASAAERVGYQFAYTMPRGGQWRASPWSIPRLPVDFRDDESRLALKLSVRGRTVSFSPVRTLVSKRRRASGV